MDIKVWKNLDRRNESKIQLYFQYISAVQCLMHFVAVKKGVSIWRYSSKPKSVHDGVEKKLMGIP